ncbi:MAG: terminase small subunit [Acidobacteria bacterium]|nr:terminase small subunit [Acidobacteriota bacterium]
MREPRCSYSPHGARSVGSRMLANINIQTAISQKVTNRARKLELTADAVLTRAMNVAFGDIRQLVGSDGRIKQINQLTEDQQCLIAGFEIDDAGRTSKVKVDGRLKALDLLARNLGLLKVDVNLTGALTVFDEETIRATPDDKLELLASHLLQVRQLMGVSA